MATSIALLKTTGRYDMPRDRMDAEVTLRPMEQLDQDLNLLPVVGNVIRGPDGTFVVFHYELTGQLNDLDVELVPFKELNERIDPPFSRMNQWLQNLDDKLQGRGSD